ncbi:ketopantoate reductase family protein [Halomonas sp. HNIBRBA4712]|uniref:ketopantoate reductase family protein n=1 Tax=Halomonas sp. HNIBRBA4712 TaxID=3373087 RepID=UPI0037477C1B
MKIAIIGAGAMGCLFAARLALSGNTVRLIDVDSDTLAAIRTRGISLSLAGQVEQVRVPIGLAEQLREDIDLILILTKGSATRTAIRAVRHIITPQTRVLTLQNGLGNAALIAEYVDTTRVLQGITTIAADLRAPGVVHGNVKGAIHWWYCTGEEDAWMKKLHEVLIGAGLTSCPDPAVESRIWEKAAFNAALNGLCTLLDRAVGAVGEHAQGKNLIEEVVSECSSIAAQCGIAFNRPRVAASIEKALRCQADHLPSMLQDRRAGRATEVESIHGALVTTARQHHLRVPVLETLYRLLAVGEPGVS